jgi:hypothetical protein
MMADAGARRVLYASVNVGAAAAIAIAALVGPAHEPRALYLILLTALCSTPLLFLEKLNGRYALLAIFCAAYYFYYGAADIATLFGAEPLLAETGLLDQVEAGVLLGAALVITGYRVSVGGQPRPQGAARDWAPAAIVAVGVLFWSVGTATVWYWQVKVQWNALTLNRNFDDTVMLLLTAGRMLQPLGTIMLAYVLFVTRNRWLLALVMAMLVVQVLVGFIGDSKETALRGLIIVIMGAFLVRGTVPKGWLVAAALFAALVFPVFQAYRSEVMGVRNMSRASAASDIGRSIALAWSAQEKIQHGFRDEYRAQSFVQRAALKPNLAMFVTKTGRDAKFQEGYTLSLFFTAFVPRMYWPDKPDTSVGQLVNREFRVSEDRDTYISATHLGEFYWNYGWPGVVVGMFAIGLLLGFINRRCDLSERRTLTRLLVLITAIYACIVRFEASIALEYTVFVRSLLIIWLLHLLFARRASAGPQATAAAGTPAWPGRIAAPQLLR